MRDHLDPLKPGRKGMVLFGLAGSGKTQLALKFVQVFGNRYSAIIWINASSSPQLSQSLTEAADFIKASLWPSKDHPNTYYGKETAKIVTPRLRSTVHNRWLLVIDSVDDIESTDFRNLIPECKHGSTIITSTRRTAAELFEAVGFSSRDIDSLDDLSATQLLLASSSPLVGASNQNFAAYHEEPGKIARELYGIPLALEQAGALIRKRIVSLESFVERYRTHYKALMAKRPARGATSYEKGHSVLSVMSLLFLSIQNESPESAHLLVVLTVLSLRKIPLSLLKETYVAVTVGQTGN
ncbi:P-loop containing nucleoside triphosphate hydrolase protein [Lasiosphaeria miniovina]|uniref:P-loop containing nucleoside triphosphate hydrolase protein n=1 Tax=Lasiosphaeria miniovina TaxID=1954250 RepID=A0AA39ZYW7_9PEZI|nr:P-loop containing nucleoside triphosphate hydrolase protein [Lasiosphaeria miniovina]KAK0706183.1 P-loop containing nucleoside triphosphate hydrolase protein [Lasiosphaeria miniovina]